MSRQKEPYKVENDSYYILKQYQEITDAGNIVSKTDPKGIITYVNDAFCKVSGYSKEELVGKPHNIVRHPDTPKETFKLMWETIKRKKEIWQGIIKNRAKNGKFYYVQTTIKPILDKKGEVLEFIALRNDITDIMNPRKQLNDLIKNCEEAVVILIKIDNYEDMEMFYGHTNMQKIEDKFAKILMELIQKVCKFERVYQLGDGEFAFAQDIKNCKENIESLSYGLKLFQEKVSEKGVRHSGIEYDFSILISFSYGKNALENAKSGLRKIIKQKVDFIFAKDLIDKEQEIAQKNINTLQIIKKAIENKNIICYFQPIIDNRTLKVKKYESLVRLRCENGSILSPFFFIKTAKKSTYYAKITSMVMENAFKALKNSDKTITINLSTLDIEKRSSRKEIFKLLELNLSDANRVVFELLEDENTKNFTQIKSFIKRVKSFGVKIAIDDFGAGYSNFERLLDYQPDILKIDGSLIKDIEYNHLSYSIVKTIVAFAKELHLETVAEYVENERIFNIVKDIGVDYSQGYYFAEPRPLL